MTSNKLVAAVAALALAAAPTAALAQSSTPVVPASETVEGSELNGGTDALGLVVVIVIVIAVYFLARDTDPELPDSP